MVEFQTIKSEEISFGNNNFIEVAKKKVLTEQGEREFLSIARGFMMLNEQKRYKQSVTVPISEEVVDFISKKLKEML